MKILVDMNLSPSWVSVLEETGHTAVHRSTFGAPNGPDREILRWARIQLYEDV
jgi:predicted nuclease of predicted toxin-antitoxin system